MDEEIEVLKVWLSLFKEESKLKKQCNIAESDLDKKVYAKYSTLTKAEIKTLVVDDKWLRAINELVRGEMNQIGFWLTDRVRTLGERYEYRLSDIVAAAMNLETKVGKHLKRMGFN